MTQVAVKPKSYGRGSMIDSLTSLRFFAAFFVFFWHSQLSGALGLNFLETGYAGVGFFYVLSGFILTYVYFDKLKKREKGSVKKFYIARIAKLYPVHILTFFAAIPLVLLSINSVYPEHTKLIFIDTAFLNLSLLQAWFPDHVANFSFNGVAWSISVELFFYTVFPVIILILAKYIKKLTIRNLVILMTLLWVVVVSVYLPQQSHVDDWNLYIFPLARLPDFLMGVFLGLLYIKVQKDSKILRKFKKINFTRIEAGAVVGFVGAMAISIIMPQSLRFGVWLMPFAAILIFVFAQQRGRLSSFFAKKPLIFLGEISFSFYMVHQIIIHYISMANMQVWAATIISLIISVAVSAILYTVYEEPMRLKLKAYMEAKFLRKVIKSQLVKSASKSLVINNSSKLVMKEAD